MARIVAFKVTRALIARFLFALHSLVSIWILYAESRRVYYWAFAASPLLLFVEGAVTILLRHGDEYKWFCPSVFIFLCGSVPPIWLLELKTTHRAVHNITQQAGAASLVVDLKWIGYVMFELPQLPGQMWLQVVEQSLLVILILGRWLLPKGRITRDELSQLLLAYLAISADIVELFNLFQEREIRMSVRLSLLVLCFWTVSLVQFPFVITTVKSQKARFCFSNEEGVQQGQPIVVEAIIPDKTPPDKGKWGRLWERVADVRVWGILSTILLQDLPFWVLRIYLIFWQNVMSYTMFFFICKNSLIMWVQLYRLIIICGEHKDGTEEDLIPIKPPSSTMVHARLLASADEETSGNKQNGTAEKIVDPPRRPSSLNITGEVRAADILAHSRRNALTAPKLKDTFARRANKEKGATTKKGGGVQQQPVIGLRPTSSEPAAALATPDSPTDL